MKNDVFDLKVDKIPNRNLTLDFFLFTVYSHENPTY